MVILGTCAGAQTKVGPVAAQHEITAEMRKDDPRLDRPITVRLGKTSVGAFLSEVSRQSGVAITASERDGAADESVMVVCQEVPLARMLNALWSCMSYRLGFWECERTGEKGDYRYRFVQSGSAQRLRQRLRDEQQRKLERDAALLVEAAEGTEAQKKAALMAVCGDPDNYAKNQALTPERFWIDMKSFKEALSPEQRLAVLRGRTIAAPISRLSSESQAYYHKTYLDLAAQYAPPGSGRPPLVEQKLIYFEPELYHSTKAITIYMPNCTTHMPGIGGAYTVRAWWARMKALWKLDGDAQDGHDDSVVMTRPDNATPEPPPPTERPNRDIPSLMEPDPDTVETGIAALARRLEQVSQGARVPLVARIPEDETQSVPRLSEPWGSALKEYWKQLWNQDLMVKWREGVLIVSTTSWPNEDPPIPNRLLVKLRKDAIPGRILPMDTLITVAEALTKPQLERIEREFPVMKEVAIWRGIFLLFNRFPELAKGTGRKDSIPLTDSLSAAIATYFTEEQVAVLQKSGASRLTITIDESNEPGVAMRQINLLFRAADGHLVCGFGYREGPQPFKKRPADSR